MATITAATPTSLSVVVSAGAVQKRSLRTATSSVLGLPAMGRRGRMRCCSTEENNSSASKKSSHVSLTAALMAATSARMSTEGTGLPFGLSNNLLGWILFGIFGLIWTLYFVYTSTLDEDEDSGLSL
ncbi:hypothetical protein MKW98_000777 [Papaver atlanticum]|uniref:PSII 6.1 kDa protein n=1 Tax=Papaver atlanticum TaxID=357466 RepID=A0AAD4SDW2_9MAGN|nr:hypothetical protein MKW98_000777 [Papaver atlanticum]